MKKESHQRPHTSEAKNEGAQWRSINGDNQSGILVPEEFSFREFIRDRKVRMSFVVALLGSVLAGSALYVSAGTIRNMLCILGACLTLGAVGQITGYINKRTAYEIIMRENKGEHTSGKEGGEK